MSSEVSNAALIRRPAFRVCGIFRRTSNSQAEEIGDLWRRYFQGNVKDQIPHRLNDAIFAVYCDYESDHSGEYTLVLGHEVSADSESPGGMVVKTIPDATYRIIDARGEQPGAVVAAWQQVWASGVARAYTADFDQYLSADLVRVHVAVNPA